MKKYANHETITIQQIKAVNMMGPDQPDGSRSGFLMITFNDVTARLMDGDKEVGSVSGCIGGGLKFKLDDEAYYVSPTELWNAFVEAVGKPEKKIKAE